MKKLFFGCITLLRGTRSLAVQLRTISASAFRASRTALQNSNFLRVYDGV